MRVELSLKELEMIHAALSADRFNSADLRERIRGQIQAQKELNEGQEKVQQNDMGKK